MGLGEKVKDTFERIFDPLVDALLWPMQQAIEFGAEKVIKAIAPNFYTYAKSVNEAIESASASPSLKEMIESGELEKIIKEGFKSVPGGALTSQEVQTYTWLSRTASIIGSPMGLFPLLGSLFNAGQGELYANAGRWLFRPTRLTPDEAIRNIWYGTASVEAMKDEIADQGYPDGRIDELERARLPLLNPDIIRQLKLRGEKVSTFVLGDQERAGWTKDRIEAMEALYKIIPGAQDLIRMAVREAFSPDIISKYQTGADFPPEFAAWAEKIGLSTEWAQRFWYAHWDLPSASQGFEMLHRGIIGSEDLDTLLRTLDVMPYWRDRLTQIAYNPLTRVDVRRMHALGVLTRDQVKKSYQDLGYNEANAELMTRFTEEYNQTAEKDLTKTEVLSLYKDGELSYDDAYELLTDLGYDDETAAWLIEQKTAEASEETKDLSLTQIKSLALASIINKGEATGRLAELGYSTEDIERIYALWDLEAAPNIKLPSRTDLTNFWKAGIIDDDTWYDEMFKQGYQEEYIIWYYLLMSESKE